MMTIVHYSVMSIVINIDRWDHEHHKIEMNGSCHIDDSIGLIRMIDSMVSWQPSPVESLVYQRTNHLLAQSHILTQSLTHRVCIPLSLQRSQGSLYLAHYCGHHISVWSGHCTWARSRITLREWICLRAGGRRGRGNGRSSSRIRELLVVLEYGKVSRDDKVRWDNFMYSKLSPTHTHSLSLSLSHTHAHTHTHTHTNTNTRTSTDTLLRLRLPKQYQRMMKIGSSLCCE